MLHFDCVNYDYLYIFIFTLILNIFELITKFYWHNWRTVDYKLMSLEY